MITILRTALLTVVLSAAFGQEWTPLFNGENLDGWVINNMGTEVPESLWSVKDGVLAVKSRNEPRSALLTEATYSNYELELEWRWPSRPGNSGLLIHSTEQPRPNAWPRSIEVQLANRKAGEFWLWGRDLTVPAEQVDPDKNIHRFMLGEHSEKEAGEWNKLRVIAKDATVEIYVNDELKNKATESSHTEGFLGLQGEGADIEFRNIRMRPAQ